MKTTLAALALLLAAPAFAQDEVVSTAPQKTVTIVEATTIQADDHIYGDADAPSELVVYASVTCGHCGKWFTEQWPEVKARADAGDLRVALREVPTTPAQVSVAGFMLANCAGEEAYFTNIERQFQEQQTTIEALQAGEGQARFVEMSEAAGLGGEDAIQACLSDDTHYAPIERSITRFEAAGGNGVPMFFLDGKEVGDAHDASDILALLDATDVDTTDADSGDE